MMALPPDKDDWQQTCVCEALKIAIHGKNADDPNESLRLAFGDAIRCVNLP